MRGREISRALAGARATFDLEVRQIAEQAHAQLLSYFQKRGWSYITGNGTWVIRDRHDRDIDDSKLPADVREILYLKGSGDQCLGTFIRDIKRAMFCVKCGVNVDVSSKEGCPRCHFDTLVPCRTGRE